MACTEIVGWNGGNLEWERPQGILAWTTSFRSPGCAIFLVGGTIGLRKISRDTLCKNGLKWCWGQLREGRKEGNNGLWGCYTCPHLQHLLHLIGCMQCNALPVHCSIMFSRVTLQHLPGCCTVLLVTFVTQDTHSNLGHCALQSCLVFHCTIVLAYFAIYTRITAQYWRNCVTAAFILK